MRFTLIKDLKKDTSMRPILTGLLIFTLLYLISDIFVKYSSFGISTDAVKLTLFGNEEEFIDPISESSFLEFWHMEIFFIMMILLTLSAVFIRVSNKSNKDIFLTNITMISAIISLISLIGSFYLSSAFIEIYVVTFFTWHIAAIYMSLFSIWKLNYDKSI